MIKPEPQNHGSAFQQERITGLWIAAAVFSLIFNIALFGFIPCLTDLNINRPEGSQFVETVNFIRIKRPEPVRKKEKEHKIRPKEDVKKLIQKKAVYQNRTMDRLVDLPFEINPKLPAISGTLKVPPMETVRLDLKGSYGIGEIDHQLTPLSQVPPIYPMRARHMGIEGWVRVKFIVDEDGRVDDIKILENSQKNIFDNAVVRCVSSWRFTPGTVEGVPVKTWVETTIRFDLE